MNGSLRDKGIGILSAIIIGALMAGALTVVVRNQRQSAGQVQKVVEAASTNLGKTSTISITSQLFKNINNKTALQLDPYILAPGESYDIAEGDASPSSSLWRLQGGEIVIAENANQNLPQATYALNRVLKESSRPDLVTGIELIRREDNQKMIIPSLASSTPVFSPSCEFRVDGTRISNGDHTVGFNNSVRVQFYVRGLLPTTPLITFATNRASISNASYEIAPNSVAPASHRNVETAGSNLLIWEGDINVDIPMCCGKAFDDWTGCNPIATLTANVIGVSSNTSCSINLKGDRTTLNPPDHSASSCKVDDYLKALGSHNTQVPPNKRANADHQKLRYSFGPGNAQLDGTPNTNISLITNRKKYTENHFDFVCQRWKNETDTVVGADGITTTVTTKVKDGPQFLCPYAAHESSFFNEFRTKVYEECTAITTKTKVDFHGVNYNILDWEGSTCPYMPAYLAADHVDGNTAVQAANYIKIVALSERPGQSGCTSKTCGSRDDLGCFIEGSELVMYDGSTKRIEDIRVGDKLLNPMNSKPAIVDFRIVGKEEIPMIEVFHSGGVETVTEGHPFLTKRGLLKASQLKTGDEIISKYKSHKILFIEKAYFSNSPTVWNIIVNRHSSDPNDHYIMSSSGIASGDYFLQKKIHLK